MRPPIVVGIILAAAVIALGFFAPYIGTGDARATWRAQQQAELARRDLARVSVDTARIAGVVDAAGVRADPAAMERAAEQSGDALRKQASEAQKSLSRAQQIAREAGLPPPNVTGFSPTPAGLQQALGGFEQALKADAALLNQALEAARAGVREKGDAIGVQYAVGVGEYIKASNALYEAEDLRTQQLAAQSRLLGLAARWKQLRALVDQFKGFQTAPVMARLQEDQAEFSKLRAEADTALLEAQRAVAEREQGLARVDAEIKQARAALLEHERKGFTPGDDGSFLAYRSRYLELATRLRELQEEEHELRFGGRSGGAVDVDALAASVERGREVAPYATLTAQLERAQRRAELLSTANVELENQVKYLDDLARRAEAEAARHEAQLAAIVTEQQETMKQVGELASAALAKEGAAIASANAATSAFSQAQQAISAWVRAARELQQNLDPERRNERLNLLLKDQYIEQVGSIAEAAARILAGRVSALQVESGTRTLADMQTFALLNPDAAAGFDPAPFDTLVNAARSAGMGTLDRARQILEKAATAPPTTAWAPLGMLAAAQHLAARIDAAQADALRAQALATVEKAVEKREQSPYLAALVAFRDHLRGGPAIPVESPVPAKSPATEPNAPAANPGG